MAEPRRCRTGGAARVTLPAEFPVCRELSLPARVRSVRTFGRSSKRPATTIISIEPHRSDLSLARDEVLRRRERCGLGTLPFGTPSDGTPPDLGGGQAPQARPRPGGDGRDEDRRAQDHQRPSLAAGEIQAAGGRCGSDKEPAPAVRVVNPRPRRVSARSRVLCMQEQQGICCRAPGRRGVDESVAA